MKKTKILSLLLSLSLFCSLIVPGTTAYAETGTAPGSGDNGMKISKTATANSDGTYTIKLEAFATGEKTTQTTDVPTDIVLVLDQSGSMGDDMGKVTYTPYTGGATQNQNNYANRHNDGRANLWYKLDDGSFVSVSVTLQQTITYNKIEKGRNDNGSNGYTNYWNNQNNLYTYVNGEIKKVIYTRERDWPWQDWNCKYALEDGTILNQNNGGSKFSPTFQNTDDGYLYLAVTDESQNVYTYTYTDTNGTTQTIGTSSTGANTYFSPAFYQRSTSNKGGGTRIAALKTAATTFANAVAKKAGGKDENINTEADNVNHRIAVVGFASQSGYGDNTELLSIKGYNSGSVGVAYNDITDQNLKDVLQSMDKQAGQKMVTDAINALAANGATRTDLGMDMANRILEKNPLVNNETRNRVVVVFTDGSPTSVNGFNKIVAQNAINTAKAIKDGNTTVYTIGIFAGADAASAGAEPSKNLEEGNRYMSAASNWFMQKLSSNNGTPQQPSYYLSAGDADSLNSIFKQISNNIGGSSTTLGSETVVKDIISPYFTLPAGATANDIHIDTYECTGKTGDTYTWETTSSGNGDATAKVEGDKVSVTGFDFSQNWCGTETNAQGSTTVRGKKLVISFKVKPKADFLGGNDVYTNTNAGIYENSSAQKPIMEFEQPTVNVPIEDVTVNAEDKNVYLKGEVTADQLKNGAEVSVGKVKLDLSKADQNYGLKPWQTEYVKITVKVKGEDGKEISADSLKNLTDDKTYTVEVTVEPTTTGTYTTEKGDAATAKSNTANVNINVFKPELTFKDSTAYYGADVPEYTGNLTETEWKHGETSDTSVTMTTGDKPKLDITYTPETGKIEGNKINTKQDVPVSATVKIGADNVNEHTTFVHDTCTETGCSWKDPTAKGDPAFLIHVKTCTLSITKTGGADDESYVFDVYKDGNGNKYSEVTIWGNDTATLYELPVGTYTIKENEGWSWRYTADNGSGATLNANNPTGEIICNNTQNKHQWLNGFSTVVRNIYDEKH